MPHVSNSKTDEVTAAQLAVDTKVKECEFSHAFLKLQTSADRPDVTNP